MQPPRDLGEKRAGVFCHSPRPLKGGSGDTSKTVKGAESLEERQLPQVHLPKVENGYATLIASGFDTVVETFDLIVPENVYEEMEMVRADAEASDQTKPVFRSVAFGGETIQLSSRRPKGGKFFLQNDDFQLTFRAPGMEWNVSVRFSSGGLWEYGWEALRGRVLAMLARETKPRTDDWQRLTEVHFAFDFYSPKFTAEMVPALLSQVVCHSSTKKTGDAKTPAYHLETWGRGVYLETLTIGKRCPCEIQVYDKGKEITEVSGKTWMVKIWEKQGFFPPDDKILDVWRLEVRMRGDFLKNRKANTLDGFKPAFKHLVSEALVTRRLCVVTSDSNRARWPMHQLWAAAYRGVGAHTAAPIIGHTTTEAPAAIEQRLLKAAAGLQRNLTILRFGDYDADEAAKVANQVTEMIEDDKDHDKKVQNTIERYKYKSEAK